jgi:hypothetical protein
MGKGRDKRRRKERKASKRVEVPGRMAEPPPNDSFNDPDASVYAPVKPKPRPLSGAIALPEPDDMDEVVAKLQMASFKPRYRKFSAPRVAAFTSTWLASDFR